VDPWRELMRAIIVQAGKDLAKPGLNAGAIMWLLSADCSALCEVTSIDHRRVIQKAMAGHQAHPVFYLCRARQT
jgi:selenophosphate synthetase-related protein